MRLTSLLAFIALLVAPAEARAQVHPRVQVDSSSCPELSRAAITRVLGIELGNMFVGDEAATGAVTVGHVSCADLAATIRVDDPITGKSLVRVVDVSSTPKDARPRLVALAVVELVAASWTELLANPTPVVPAALPVPADTRREAADLAREKLSGLRSLGSRFRIVAAFDASYLSGASTGLLGGGLEVSRDLIPWLALGLQLRGEHGRSTVPLGAVDVDLFSATLLAAASFKMLAPTLRLALGDRIGVARIAGIPNDPARAVGGLVANAYSGPLVQVGLQFDVWRGFIVEVGSEGGLVALPVRGHTGAGDVSVSGSWLGGAVALGALL